MTTTRRTVSRRSLLGAMAVSPLVLPSGVALAQTPTASPAAAPVDLDALLRPIFDASGAPGAIVSVRHGGTRRDIAFGRAALDPERAATTADSFRIGSISKTMLATAALQQVAAGLIDLDVPVSIYIDGLHHGDEITTRQLLGMTSGLMDFLKVDWFLPTVLTEPSRVWTIDELIAIGDELPLEFTPGSAVSYSNTGYTVITKVVETVTSRNIADIYREDIFEPLGMAQTSLPLAPETRVPDLRGYIDAAILPSRSATPEPAGSFIDMTDVDVSAYGAAGGVVSTMDDLQVWVDALLSGSSIGADLQAQRTAFRPWNDDMYGLGIMRRPTSIGHDGTLPGYNTAMFRSDAGTTAIAVANSEPSTSDAGFANDMLAAIFTALDPAGP